ncbi:MAG TPA: hypothetical protein VNZ45_07340 [Bacteroidia bacterium]|jgi:hypothetical protein|nr:hypothetical protein [Bacteroidia bacterium]
MKMDKRKRLFLALGLILTSGSALMGSFASSSIFIDFIRGFAVGFGIILILSSFFTKRPKKIY